MKCQKCNYVSFDYLDACVKCGSDLEAQKTKLGLDVPRFKSLGVLEHLAKKKAEEEEKARQASQVTGTAVLEEPETEIHDDYKNPHDIDLSAAEEHPVIIPEPEHTAELEIADLEPEPVKEEIKTETADVEPIPAEPEQPAQTAVKAPHLGIVEPATDVAPPSDEPKEIEFSLDIDLDGAMEAEKKTEPEAIDFSGMDLEISEHPALEPPKQAENKTVKGPDSLNLDGLDLSFDDIDLNLSPDKGKDKPAEKKTDIDIDLSDLKLE